MPRIKYLIAKNLEEALRIGDGMRFPIEVSSSFSLAWCKTATNQEDLKQIVEQGLAVSPVGEISLRAI